MKVDLINHTSDADSLLLFTKETRLELAPGKLEEFKKLSQVEREEKLKYVFGTISSSWEFVDYVFLITGVTRAFTHQLVRHRVGTSFAQQAQRVAQMKGFGYLTTGTVNDDEDMKYEYQEGMKDIQLRYDNLLDMGARPQDARGLLPTNILTNIVFKVNLRALSGMLETRLCVRAQGEFQKVAHAMKAEAVAVHPWAEPVLNCFCVVYGRCKWPRYQDCPIKKHYHFLDNVEDEVLHGQVKLDLEELTGFDPQPDPTTSWKEDKKDGKRGKRKE
jgi:thymidylate synthase (FAD)